MDRVRVAPHAATQRSTLVAVLMLFSEGFEMHSKELILAGFADYVVHLAIASEDHSYALTDLW